MSSKYSATFLIILLFSAVAAVQVEKGSIAITILTGDISNEFKVDILANQKVNLNLTQSSKIQLISKVHFAQQDCLQ